MSTCALPSFEELENSIKNKKAIRFAENKTQSEIAESVSYSNSMLELRDQHVPTDKIGTDRRRYSLVGSDAFLTYRATDAVSLMYRRIYGDTGTNQDSDNMEYGNTVHKIMQDSLNALYTEYKDGTVPDFKSIATKYNSGNFSLSNEQINNLIKGAKEIIEQLTEAQNKIDSSKKFILLAENVVFDPVRDLGGTIDVLAVFSDATAGVLDFKSFSPKSMYTSKNSKTGKKVLTSRDFIAKSKRDGWKIQMSNYKKILLEYYGVKDIRFTRIVPVWMDYKKNELGKILSVEQVQIGKKQSEFLNQRTIEGDKFSNAAVDLFLETIYSEINNIELTYSNLSRTQRDAALQRLNKLYEAVDDFVLEMDVDGLLQDAFDVANKEYESYKDLNTAVNYLEAVVTLKRNLEDTVDTIDIPFDTNKLEYITKQLAYFKEVRTEKLLDSIKNDGHGELNTVGGKIVLSEDDIITQTMLPTSKSENPIIQYASTLFAESYTKQREALTKFDKEFAKVEAELIKWLSGRGESLKDVHKYILNREEGHLHYRISKGFMSATEEARTKKDVSFFTTNYQIRNKNGKGETYKEWYNRSLKEQENILNDRYSRLSGDFKRNQVERGLEFWKSMFDLSLTPSGTPVNPKAWLNKNNSWLELKPTTFKSNMSDEYKFISTNKPLLDYYNFILNSVADWRKIVGYNEIDSAYFYPMVRSSMMEKLSESSLYSLISDARTMFDVRQDQQMFGSRDFDRESEKYIPIYFTQPFRDADGNIDSKQVSTDISASFRIFAKVVYNHQYMNEIEAEILATKELLKTVEYEKGGWGKNVFNFMHNIAVKDKTEGGNMTDAVFNTLVDYHLYGVKTKAAFGDEKLTKNVKSFMSWFSLRSLGLGIVPATASYVSSQINARLEAVKGQLFEMNDWNTAIKNSIKDHKKYHGLAFTFGVHNEDVLTDIVSGRVGNENLIGNKLYNNKLNQYINQRVLMRPWSYGEERLENHITNSMALTYGIDSDGNVRKLENLPDGTKSIYERFIFNETEGSFEIDGLEKEKLIRVITQFKQAVRAAQKKITGTMSSDDIAYWQTNLAAQLFMQFKSWMPNILEERFGKVRYNKVLDIVEQGRYAALWQNNELETNANTFVYLASSAINTLKFLTVNLATKNTIARKLLNTDVKLDEERLKRQYKAFVKRYEKSPGVLARIPSYEQFVKMKEGQIRAAIGEAEVLLLLLSAIAMLGADWDDNGEPLWSEMWITRKMYRVLNRTKTELSFTYSYPEYIKLVQNPIPITSALNTSLKLIQNTLDEFRDDVFGENNSRDKAGRLHYSTSMLTGVYQLRKFFDILESDLAATR